MPRLNANPAEHEREFQMNIVVSETGECRVKVMERGESQSGASASTPLSGMLGLRECLRLGRLMVSQFYNTKQRALDLTSKAAALAERKRRPPRPQTPPVMLADISGPLTEAAAADVPEARAEATDVPWLEVDEVSLERPGPLEEGFQTHSPESVEQGMPWCDWCACYHHDTAECITKDGRANPARSYDGVATVAEDAAIEKWAEEQERQRLLAELQALEDENAELRHKRRITVLTEPRVILAAEEGRAAAIEQLTEEMTTEAEKYVGPLDDEQRETMRDIVADHTAAPVIVVDESEEAALEPLALTISTADLPAEAKVPGVDVCLECGRDLDVADGNQAVCRNPACAYYEPPSKPKPKRKR